ncbi:hypothetical protein EOM09_06950 [bacterium]|nr:hypothetical protein [bacterium]
MKDIYITDFHRFELMNKIRSVSTLTTKNSKMLEPYLSPVFKIFDGIEVCEQVKEKKQTEKLTFGCYLEDFKVINPFFLNEIASLNPNYNFLFISKNSTPINFDFKKNIQQVIQQPDINLFDYILFPFEKEEPYEVNKTFYLNLRFNAPMLAIQSLELKHNEAFVNQYKKKANLMLALKNIESIKHPDSFEKEILKQNIDWQTRIKQLESIILAYS